MDNVAAGGRSDLKPLTSLRFAAALLVFFDHAPISRKFGEQYALGESAVAFFFLLSGFILIVNYQRAFAERLTWDAMRRFYVARVARVYPLQVATSVLAVAALCVFGEPAHSEFGRLWVGLGGAERTVKVLAGLLLFQPWFQNSSIAFGINPPAWSIADEAFFYALFPFVAWYALRAFRSFSGLVVLAVAALVWLVTAFTFWHSEYVAWIFYNFPPIRFIDFFIGLLLGLAYLKRAAFQFRLGTLLEVLAVVAVVAALAVSPRMPDVVRYGLWMMPASALLISIFAHQSGTISRWLSQPWLIFLGEASFGFYLIHNIALLAARVVLGPTLASAIVAMTATLGLSCLSLVFFEAPLRRIIRRHRPHEAHGAPGGIDPRPEFAPVTPARLA